MTKNLNENKLIEDILNEMDQSSIEFKVGGPFGAVIYKNGKIVGKGVNRVIGNNDPTAHAEIIAIRNACKNLKTYDLTDCEMYATGYPCPMCMSAIIWANIKKVYYSADYKDAQSIGFRDDYIFNYIKNNCKDKETLELIEIKKEPILNVYQKFVDYNGQIY